MSTTPEFAIFLRSAITHEGERHFVEQSTIVDSDEESVTVLDYFGRPKRVPRASLFATVSEAEIAATRARAEARARVQAKVRELQDPASAYGQGRYTGD